MTVSKEAYDITLTKKASAIADPIRISSIAFASGSSASTNGFIDVIWYIDPRMSVRVPPLV